MKEELKEEELNETQQDAQQTSSQTEQNETNEAAQEKNADASEPVTEEQTIEEQLEAANQEIASLKDQLLRKIAEFDNYRKRTIKEKTRGRGTHLQEVHGHSGKAGCQRH